MTYRTLTLHLPEKLLSAAEAAAHNEAMSVAQLVRNALAGVVGQGPEHPHGWLADRIAGDHPPGDDTPEADDFEVIDRSDMRPTAPPSA